MLGALQYEFMRNALIAGVLAAVACGIIGTYVVVKRMVSVSGAISHSSFGGIGLGYFVGINPVLGALFFTIASAPSADHLMPDRSILSLIRFLQAPSTGPLAMGRPWARYWS